MAVTLLAGACASAPAGKSAFQEGLRLAYAGDWDGAVVHLTQAVQEEPDRADYRVQLQQAMFKASLVHLGKARELERQGDLETSLFEYRRTIEYNPSNREAIGKIAELERAIRLRLEASKPRPQIADMQDRARQQMQEPLLSPASREPLDMRFTNASTKDILDAIGKWAGVNVTYERDFRPSPFSIQLEGVTLEAALEQIMSANQLWYKVVNDRTILVIPDNNQKRQTYEDQLIRTFYVSHADPTELGQLINTVTRVPGAPLIPTVAVNKTGNSITVRGTRAMLDVIERVIRSNDKPRAEIIVDVEILEVNRVRAQQYGLNLSQYAIGTIFSPDKAPVGGTGTGTDGSGGAAVQPLINLNSITRGVSAADFYMAVPQAIVKFLASDSTTRQLAKPQLRGTEGQKLTLNLGDEIPVPSTVFTPIATGGSAVNPLTSFTYRPVGVNIEMTPRVTFEDEIVLDLVVESSNQGGDVNIAGNALPSFGSRKVTTRLRLREGESNLLAGLLSERERKALSGIPGLINVPVLKEILAGNDKSFQQTDIVMLLTPRIVRGHELTDENLAPITIGTQQRAGMTAAPSIFGPAPAPDTRDAAPPAAVVATRLTSVSTRVEGAALRVTIKADGRLVPGTIQEIKDGSPRLALDFPGLSTSLAPVIPIGSGDVERIRAAQHSRTPLVARLVFDLRRPVTYRIDTSGQDRGELLVVLGDEAAPEAPPPTLPPAPPAAEAAPAPEPAKSQVPTPTGPAPGVPRPPIAAPAGVPGAVPAAPEQQAGVAAMPGPGVAPAGTTRVGSAATQILAAAPGEFDIDGGSFSVPISITGAERVSVVSLSLSYNPAVLRVRVVQEGGFLRQGGVTVTFAQQVDATGGRVDISMTRTADATGASGAGLLAAVLFEPVAVGASDLTLSGVATSPEGSAVPLSFTPAHVNVR